MARTKLSFAERAQYRGARALAALPPRVQVGLAGRRSVVSDGQRLEPEIQLTLSMLEKRNDPSVEDLPPAQGRALTRRQAEVFSGAELPVGAVRDLTVPGAAGPLPARLYSPSEPGSNPGPHPLLVFLHGGGFVIGDLDTHDAPCRLLCKHAGVHVLAVDYRLAPEHPFPAAAEDAVAVTRWALAEGAQQLGADPDRVLVGGDSAGGNLSAVACLMLTREGEKAPAAQLLIYPSVAPKLEGGSLDTYAEGFYLTRKQMLWFREQYIPEGSYDPADPMLSPLEAEDLSGLPPAIVITAGFDPLRDQGEAYARRLREAGVPTLLRRFPGLIHAFINTIGVSRVSRDALVEIAGATRALTAVLDPAGPAREPALDPEATPAG